MAIKSFPDDSDPEEDHYDTDWGCVTVVLAIIALLALMSICETIGHVFAPQAAPPAVEARPL